MTASAPAALTAAAKVLDTEADRLRDVRRRLIRRADTVTWEGPAARRFQASIRRRERELDAVADDLHARAGWLRSAAQVAAPPRPAPASR
ncbi:hypothetical protein KSP35_00510 [Aquihabitans sp. G128]|uniref:hypothetical protein n=1 Tax=Aquihabitans sp. G128 TaxID=2849779 RepID=UPI001C24E2E0|nr:hypothetical protein [Aquihabitans sp. G128]QXC61373.1 hypothetical protein KSP35_00510 [Aquihabitans sp. G128]